MKTIDPPVIVEQSFDRTPEEVWNAITKLDCMHLWYFDNIPDFKTEVGFKTQFNVKAPSRDFLHVWEVTEVINGKRIMYTWEFTGLVGKSHTIFEIEEQGNKTKLILTAEVLEDFDDSIPEFRRESCIAGWTYFIKERLSAYFLKYD